MGPWLDLLDTDKWKKIIQKKKGEVKISYSKSLNFLSDIYEKYKNDSKWKDYFKNLNPLIVFEKMVSKENPTLQEITQLVFCILLNNFEELNSYLFDQLIIFLDFLKSYDEKFVPQRKIDKENITTKEEEYYFLVRNVIDLFITLYGDKLVVRQQDESGKTLFHHAVLSRVESIKTDIISPKFDQHPQYKKDFIEAEFKQLPVYTQLFISNLKMTPIKDKWERAPEKIAKIVFYLLDRFDTNCMKENYYQGSAFNLKDDIGNTVAHLCANFSYDYGIMKSFFEEFILCAIRKGYDFSLLTGVPEQQNRGGYAVIHLLMQTKPCEDPRVSMSALRILMECAGDKVNITQETRSGRTAFEYAIKHEKIPDALFLFSKIKDKKEISHLSNAMTIILETRNSRLIKTFFDADDLTLLVTKQIYFEPIFKMNLEQEVYLGALTRISVIDSDTKKENKLSFFALLLENLVSFDDLPFLEKADGFLMRYPDFTKAFPPLRDKTPAAFFEWIAETNKEEPGLLPDLGNALSEKEKGKKPIRAFFRWLLRDYRRLYILIRFCPDCLPAVDEMGRTILHYAIFVAKKQEYPAEAEAIYYLLFLSRWVKGVGLDGKLTLGIQDADGNTALHYLCYYADYPPIFYVAMPFYLLAAIKEGFPFNNFNQKGQTLLHILSRISVAPYQLQIEVEEKKRELRQPSMISLKSTEIPKIADRETPLEFFLTFMQEKYEKTPCKEMKIKVNEVSSSGTSAIAYALLSNNFRNAEVLLKAGADPFLYQPPAMENEVDRTPIHIIASKIEHQEMCYTWATIYEKAAVDPTKVKAFFENHQEKMRIFFPETPLRKNGEDKTEYEERLKQYLADQGKIFASQINSIKQSLDKLRVLKEKTDAMKPPQGPVSDKKKIRFFGYFDKKSEKKNSKPEKRRSVDLTHVHKP